MMRDLLTGRLDGARRDAILLNAAMTLAADGGEISNCLAEAEHSLDSGAAHRKLEALLEYSQAFADPPLE
jgi:anthranilate phosphoribosyltransferase